MLTETTVRT